MERYLKYQEEIVFALRALYEQYAYRRYKMNKFEEYDFYAENKQFLVSSRVITFTDTNGRLMALKPDVTLSIARHHADADGILEKVYYDENVYRAGEDGAFREITQTGLEALGALDTYTVGETVLLAVKSLQCLRQRYVLDISHMGLLKGTLSAAKLPDRAAASLVQAIESRNVEQIKELFADVGGDTALCDCLCRLTGLYGGLHEVMPQLEPLCRYAGMAEAYRELSDIDSFLNACGVSNDVRFDFSLVNDREYYNGVVFRGFAEGVPSAVLSGGRYDHLMKKLGKRSDAIGFAVYLDRLERLHHAEREYDADVLLIYDTADFMRIAQTVKELTDAGKSVRVQRGQEPQLKCRALWRLSDRGIEVLKSDD